MPGKNRLAKPYVASGKMRPLVGDIKSAHFDCPTFAEKGYPRVAITNALSILGPKGLPLDVAEVWENTLERVMKEPNFMSAYEEGSCCP
jgi:tripartite-type tricarboxylate transporter receptor subunit TctC